MEKPKTLEQLRAEKERAETQLSLRTAQAEAPEKQKKHPHDCNHTGA